jgi:hypothetical protein
MASGPARFGPYLGECTPKNVWGPHFYAHLVLEVLLLIVVLYYTSGRGPTKFSTSMHGNFSRSLALVVPHNVWSTGHETSHNG